MIREQLKPAILMFLVFTFLTGVLYPWFVTEFAKNFFKTKANGSVVYRGDKAVGSDLIGQNFDDPKYFWGRLSATSPVPYNATASSGSNYGPANKALLEAVQARIKALKEADPSNTASIPVDLVTASASGLDPDISVASARYQASRIARVRKIDKVVILKMIDFVSEGPQLGFLGQARVNVLKLNFLLNEWEKNPAINLEKPKQEEFSVPMKWGNWENPRKL